MSTCRPVNMLPGLTGQKVNKGVQGVSYLSPCRPVNLSTRVDRLLWLRRLVHLSFCLQGRTGADVNILFIKAIWVIRTCSYVNLSTCLPGLTGPEVDKGVHGIMGIPYLLTCRPVNLSTRVDRFRSKYRSSSAYGYSVFFHLPGLTGQNVNI